MSVRVSLRFLSLCVVCSAGLPGFAQDTGGIQTRFGFEQGIEFERNPSLAIDGTDNQTALATTLTFGLESSGRAHQLALDTSAIFRARNASDETTSAVDSVGARLSYQRVGANSELQFNSSIDRREIDTLLTIADFLTDDGTLELPEDLSDLSGTGLRFDRAISASLLLGTQGPLGFQIDLGTNALRYEDTTDPSLIDVERRNVGVTASAAFSEVLTGRVSYRFEDNDEDNLAQTFRTVQNVSLGFDLAASPRLTLSGALGTQTTRIEDIGGDSETSDLTGNLGLSYDLPNGNAGATLDVARDALGDQITTLVASRRLELPRGALGTQFGVTQSSESDLEFVGSLDWTRAFPAGALTLRLDRSVAPDEDDLTQTETVAGAFYRQSVNRVSAINFEALVTVAGETAVANEVRRTDVAIRYERALTRDWSLNAGLRFTSRDEETVGEAETSQISLSIGREFNARR